MIIRALNSASQLRMPRIIHASRRAQQHRGSVFWSLCEVRRTAWGAAFRLVDLIVMVCHHLKWFGVSRDWKERNCVTSMWNEKDKNTRRMKWIRSSRQILILMISWTNSWIIDPIIKFPFNSLFVSNMSTLICVLRGVLAIVLVVLLDEIGIYLSFQYDHLWDRSGSGYAPATILPSLFSIQKRETNRVCCYLPLS